MSELININEHLHFKMTDSGGAFIAKFQLSGLNAVTLSKDELKEILSYYERD